MSCAPSAPPLISGTLGSARARDALTSTVIEAFACIFRLISNCTCESTVRMARDDLGKPARIKHHVPICNQRENHQRDSQGRRPVGRRVMVSQARTGGPNGLYAVSLLAVA